MVEKTRKYYKLTKIHRDHEREMMSMRIFEKMCGDPEFKYFLGMIGGIGVAGLIELFKKIEASSTGLDTATGKESWESSHPKPVKPLKSDYDGRPAERFVRYNADITQWKKDILKWEIDKIASEKTEAVQDGAVKAAELYSFLQFGPGGYILGQAIKTQMDKGKESSDPIDKILTLFEIGGMSFGSFCAVVLFLKAMNPEGGKGGGFGSLLSVAGL